MRQETELLAKLLNREITPVECMSSLMVCNDRELERLVLFSQLPMRIRKHLTLNNIKTMNFMEVRHYCKNKVSKGINLIDLSTELDIKWENGEISGFDYRYFKESVGLKITKQFINRAKSIGRYGK